MSVTELEELRFDELIRRAEQRPAVIITDFDDLDFEELVRRAGGSDRVA